MSNTIEPTQLKPCIWCKGTGLHLENIDDRWFVGCHNLLCLADGPVRPTEAEAIAAWNQRVHSAPAKGHADLVEAATKATALIDDLGGEAMTEPFDWEGLVMKVLRCYGTRTLGMTGRYLRARIEAAFVPVKQHKTLEALAADKDLRIIEATARAEAAEAENAKLREALKWYGVNEAEMQPTHWQPLPAPPYHTIADSDGDDGA